MCLQKSREYPRLAHCTHTLYQGGTWQAFTKHAKDTHLSLLHDIIPLITVKKMSQRETIFRAYTTLLDFMTLGIVENFQIGSNPTDGSIVDIMPAIPTEIWAPLYKDVIEVGKDKLSDYYDFLSYITFSKLFDVPHREVEKFFSRASGHIELYSTLKEIYYNKVETAFKNKRLSVSQKSMCKIMISEALNFLIFGDKGAITIRVALLDYIKSKGSDRSKWFDLSLKIQTLPSSLADLKTVRLDDTKYKDFKGKDIQKMIASLENAARIHAMTEVESKDRNTPYPEVIEYYTENILRAQREGIINFGNFLKSLVQSIPINHRIEIRPFKSFLDGFAYATRKKYLEFFPDPRNPNNDQKFILGPDLQAFKDNFIKILGGLLIDYQTFVLSEIDENGNTIKYLCAFNLLSGALDLNSQSDLSLYTPRPSTQYYVSSPEVISFESSLYNINDPESIVNIMKFFADNDLLIGIQRIGDREQELRVFKEICDSLLFIKYLF